MELARKAETLGVWSQIKPTLMPFFNAVRAFVGEAGNDGL